MLDRVSASARSITSDEDRAHLRILLCRLELPRHSGEEAVEDKLGLNAYYRVIGAGHPCIGDERSAIGQHAGVGGWDMGVGSEYSGDAAIKIPAQRDLLAGGLGVEVEQDDRGSDLAEKLVGLAEGVVTRGHEDAALEVQHGVLLTVGKFTLVHAEAGGADRIVGRAKDATAAEVRVGRDGHVLEDLALVPDVVAGRDDVGAHVEDLFGDGRGDAKASGSVLAVDDEEVDGVCLKDVRKVLVYDMAAGGAEDVADKKDVHLKILHGREARDSAGVAGCGSLLAWQTASDFSWVYGFWPCWLKSRIRCTLLLR